MRTQVRSGRAADLSHYFLLLFFPLYSLSVLISCPYLCLLVDNPVECKYVFELASGSAVCGFEAFISDKHIIGKVEEKKAAHKKYKAAVESGKRAYHVFCLFVVF